MKPSLAISRTENFPEANTIALGGVATGSIKAKLALMVAGIMKSFGSMFAVIAATTKIGNKIVVVAVLLVTSVKKVTMRQIEAMPKKTGSIPREDIEFPSTALNPDDLKALAKHKPPANKIRTPHGILVTAFQSNSLPPWPQGSTNIKSTPMKAIEASFAYGSDIP